MKSYCQTRKTLKMTVIASALELAIVLTATAHAVSTEYSQNGIFKVSFIDEGEYIPGGEDIAEAYKTTVSTRNVTPYKPHLMKGVNYWDEIFSSKGIKNRNGALAIFAYDKENAEGYSPVDPKYMGLEDVRTALEDQIITGKVYNCSSYYGMGTFNWYLDPYVSVLSPNHNGVSIFEVSVHEIAHSLGLTAAAEEYASTFQSHLYGKVEGSTEYERFTLENYNQMVVGTGVESGVYFRGDNVTEVLQGALGDQIPVNGQEGSPAKRDLSHLELQNSFLSHQEWCNYNNLMEAELAVFQDLGYTIDRRKFYGSSEYGDNKFYINTAPFYARNAEGTAYLTGQPNTATMGVGFHIYGSNNNIIQAADLLADGTGAVGIRIDGATNTITIAPTVKVTANGDHGYGLLVAYGKNHQVISRGRILATGNGGVAVRFDFGGNGMGDEKEYRGSYMRTAEGVNKNISGYVDGEADHYQLNLDGPLASSFDLSGSLEGSYAAIYIAGNAYVNQINVLKGAAIRGDIISMWDPGDSRIQAAAGTDLFTSLNFGYGVNDDGGSTGSADSSFALTLEGSIRGDKSLCMTHEAGTLKILGTVAVYSLENRGYLAMMGTDADGYSASISSSFTAAPGSALETGFNPDGSVDRIKAETATLDGSWVLRPNRGFYQDKALISPQFPVTAAISGSFAGVVAKEAFSPTLKMRITNNNPHSPEVEMYRDRDAYAQYARRDTDRNVGRALYEISAVAQGEMQQLLTVLDYSDLQGQTVSSALGQLGPATFDYGTIAALKDSAAVSGQMLRHMQFTALGSRYSGSYGSDTLLAQNSYALTPATGRVSDRKIVGFLMPYGDYTRQNGSGGLDNMKSYSGGIVAGVECVRAEGISYGIHGGVSYRNTRVSNDNSSKIESRGLFVGLHGVLAPVEWGGFYTEGQFRVGWYENDSKRDISFGSFAKRVKGSYDSFTSGLMLGGGYDFNSGTLSFGPLVCAEYSHVHSRSFTEKNGGAASLKVKSTNADSLVVTVGGHLLKLWQPSQYIGIRADLRAGLKHEFLDDDFRTRASFADYGAYTFESHTKGAGRNSIFCQSELTLENRNNGLFGTVTFGYDHYRRANIFNVGLRAGWRF
ncbi:MAG: autotransporter outer membrane beta-barrel domain-containing protein [Succinivibrio sp.]|nr:autotransporter outer membrane beta-barrel domain-containing protein [Succinivibrio sp.]